MMIDGRPRLGENVVTVIRERETFHGRTRSSRKLCDCLVSGRRNAGRFDVMAVVEHGKNPCAFVLVVSGAQSEIRESCV